LNSLLLKKSENLNLAGNKLKIDRRRVPRGRKIVEKMISTLSALVCKKLRVAVQVRNEGPIVYG